MVRSCATCFEFFVEYVYGKSIGSLSYCYNIWQAYVMELVCIITGLIELLFLSILITALSLGADGFICNRYFYWCLLLSYICKLPIVFVSERSTWDL